jgi:hypothetical protein
VSEHIPSFYARLGLSSDSDERTIKRTYARILKTIDPDSQAVEFERLRLDYSQALDYAENPDRAYYFDDGEFVFKESLKESAPANATADTPADSPTISDSAVNLNGQAASNLDVIDPSINKTTDQDAAQAAIGSTCDEATLEFQEFCKLASNTAINLTNTELAELLQVFMQREALTSFQARTHFENLLISALAHRQLGQASGRLLISSSKMFNWNTADSKKLTDCGTDGREVLYLLDNYFGLTDIAQLQLIRLGETPVPSEAFLAIAKFEIYKKFCKPLLTYFVDEQHESAWHEAKKKIPLRSLILSIVKNQYKIFKNGISKIREWDGRLIFFGIWIVLQFIVHWNKK